jgi:hypothetical protein
MCCQACCQIVVEVRLPWMGPVAIKRRALHPVYISLHLLLLPPEIPAIIPLIDLTSHFSYRDQGLVSGPHFSVGHAQVYVAVIIFSICYVDALIALACTRSTFGNGCILSGFFSFILTSKKWTYVCTRVCSSYMCYVVALIL